jgi:hypothetical protein
MKEIYKNNRKRFCQSVKTKTFSSAIFRGEEGAIANHYRVAAISLHYISALSHNPFCCGEKLLLPNVIALEIKEPLLVTFWPLSLPKVLALTFWQKRFMPVHFEVTLPTSVFTTTPEGP